MAGSPIYTVSGVEDVCQPELEPTLERFYRGTGLEALARIKPDAETVQDLIPLLDDENDPIAEAAVEALGSLGELAKPALPKLRAMAKAEDVGLREAAQAAVKAIEK